MSRNTDRRKGNGAVSKGESTGSLIRNSTRATAVAQAHPNQSREKRDVYRPKSDRVRGTRATSAVADASPSRVVKPASRREIKQAERVRKKNQEMYKRRELNKQRAIEGKKLLDDGSVEKPTIWEKIAEDKLYYQLRQMGDSTANIDRFQRKRVFTALFLVFAGVLAGLLVHPWLHLAGPMVGFAMYKNKARTVDKFYKGWKFERQLNFSKFTRLVIPYLKAAGGNVALYTVFNKILRRTDDESDRRSLYQLMGEMGDNPTDIQPFLDYAERSSGTDMSHLFMSTIFDFQQSTFDTQVIDELGKMASEDMMNAIDEIINFKLKRFVMFPTKVVMSSFILVAGLGVGMMLHNFQTLNIGDSMNIMNPTENVTNATSDSEEAFDDMDIQTTTDESDGVDEDKSNSEDEEEAE